ncbi:hypothetical protein [Marinicrinis lubricantis]|uniref:ABC transporter permease n=1 Tax=Marinicrinis lubricantis TaxID=2086470 RepID=A0ABW1IPF8_9BACL
MNPILSVMKIHLKDRWTWFLIPWLFVLMSSFLINLLVGHIINDPEGFVTGGLSSIFVFMLIAGGIIVTQTFPFAIGMCVRRTDYFLGTVATISAFSALSAALLSLLSWIEELTEGWGTNMSYFYLPFLEDLGWVGLPLFFFILLLNAFFTSFTIASLHKRFGRKGIFTLTIVFLLMSSIVSYLFLYFEWWDEIFNWIVDLSLKDVTVWLFPLTALYMLLSYWLLRRSMES